MEFSELFTIKRPDYAGINALRQSHEAPVNDLLVLGQAPLFGATTGYLALELGPDGGHEGAKLWALCDQHHQYPGHEAEIVFPQNGKSRRSPHAPYARLCSDSPVGSIAPPPLAFWINPEDALCSSAGFGSEWLEAIPKTSCNGLVLARLNELMLDAKTTEVLLGQQQEKIAFCKIE